MTREHAPKPDIAAAREAIDALETGESPELRAILYSILRDDVRTDDLARACRDHDTTITKMSLPDSDVRLRIALLVGLAHLNREAFVRLLAPIAAQGGYRLVPESAPPAAIPSSAETIREIAEAQAATSHACTVALVRAADGDVSDEDVVVVQAAFRRAQDEMQEALDVLVARRRAPDAGDLARARREIRAVGRAGSRGVA